MSGKGKRPGEPAFGELLAAAGMAPVETDKESVSIDLPTPEQVAAADANAVWWLQCRRVRLLALACRRLGVGPAAAALDLAQAFAEYCDAPGVEDGGDLRLECLSAVIDLQARNCFGGDTIEAAREFEAFARAGAAAQS